MLCWFSQRKQRCTPKAATTCTSNIYPLNDYGFELIEAEDGLKAVELASDLHPDLILMDLKIPVMGGREAAKKIKARKCNGKKRN